MNITDRILKRIQEVRLKAKNSKTTDHNDGFLAGLDKAEMIVFEESSKTKKWAAKKVINMWQTGMPTECGDYILIAKAHFTSEENGIRDGNIYLTTDFWDGETGWESTFAEDNYWEILYFTHLKNIRFQIPEELGVSRSEEMFIK